MQYLLFQMSVTFNLHQYQLSCYSHSDKIVLRLEPLKVENKVVVQYLYQAEYHDPNLPQGIKFLFNESTSDWYRYIDYYRQNCFDLDISSITSDQYSEPNVQTQYTELPLIFKLKLIQGIKQSRFKLYGEKELFSKQLRLERMLVIKENVILQLRRQMEEKNAMIEKLQIRLGQVSEQNEVLKVENSKLLQQELPRKKVHYSQQQQQGCFSNNDPNVYRISSSNQDSNSIDKSQKFQHQNPQQIVTQQYSTENQPSLSYVDEVNGNNQRLLQQQTVKHSETFYNRPNKGDGQQSGIGIFGSQVMKSPTIGVAGSVSVNLQNKKVDIEQQRKQQPSTQVISIGVQLLSQQSVKMIREFASKKCLMEVGYDQRNQKKYGYCCIFCQKIFKEEEFLAKHLFSRHAEINNETTIEYLNSMLGNYKKRREQKIAAFEANYAAERRLANRAQILQSRT